MSDEKVTANKKVAIVTTVEEIVNKDIIEAKNIFAKIVAYFKAIPIKTAIANLEAIEEDAKKAGAVVIKEAKVTIKNIEDVTKKFEGKVISFEKLTLAEAVVIKEDWAKAIARLKELTTKK